MASPWISHGSAHLSSNALATVLTCNGKTKGRIVTSEGLAVLNRFIINTWSDRCFGKKGDAGPGRSPVMEGSYLCTVRAFRRLGMYLSGAPEFAFCIDKALVHAAFKS